MADDPADRRRAGGAPTRNATSTRCSRPRRPSSPPPASTRPRRRSPTWPASGSARCTGTSRSARTWSWPCSEREIDACADAGPALSAAHEPADALTQWIHRYTELLATKRGLASALHSGDPAFEGLPGYFWQRLGPALDALLDAAAADGEIRADVERQGPPVRRRPAVPARARTGARAQPADRRRAGRRPALRERGWITGVGGLNRGGPRCWRTDAMSLRLSILDLAPIGPGQPRGELRGERRARPAPRSGSAIGGSGTPSTTTWRRSRPRRRAC